MNPLAARSDALWFPNISRTPLVELRINLTVGPAEEELYFRAGTYRVLPGLAQHRDFVVDSGATATVISCGLASRLQLELYGRERVLWYGGREGIFYQSTVRLFFKRWHTVDCLIPESADHGITENLLGLKGIFGQFALTMSHTGLGVAHL